MILGVRCNRNPERSDAHKARPCAERRRLFSPPDKIQKAQRMAACIMLEYRHGSLWVTSDGFCKLLDLVTSVAFLPDSEKGAQQTPYYGVAVGSYAPGSEIDALGIT